MGNNIKNNKLGGVFSKTINTLLCVCLLISALSFNNNITNKVSADSSPNFYYDFKQIDESSLTTDNKLYISKSSTLTQAADYTSEGLVASASIHSISDTLSEEDRGKKDFSSGGVRTYGYYYAGDYWIDANKPSYVESKINVWVGNDYNKVYFSDPEKAEGHKYILVDLDKYVENEIPASTSNKKGTFAYNTQGASTLNNQEKTITTDDKNGIKYYNSLTMKVKNYSADAYYYWYDDQVEPGQGPYYLYTGKEAVVTGFDISKPELEKENDVYKDSYTIVSTSFTVKPKDSNGILKDSEDKEVTLDSSLYSISSDNNALGYSTSDYTIDASVTLSTSIKDSNSNNITSEVYYDDYAKYAFGKIKEAISSKYTDSEYKETINKLLEQAESDVASATSQDDLNNILTTLKTNESKYSVGYVPFTIEYNNRSNGQFGTTTGSNAPGTESKVYGTDGSYTADDGSVYKLVADNSFLKFVSITSTKDANCQSGSNETNACTHAAKAGQPSTKEVALNDEDKNYSYSKINLIAAAIGQNATNGEYNNPTVVTVKITYDDGNTSSKPINFYAWYSDVNPTNLTSGVEGITVTRISEGLTASSGESGKKFAYEYEIPVDSNKTIKSITFTSTDATNANGCYEVAIFAISGKIAKYGEASYIKAYVDGVGYTSISDAIAAVKSSGNTGTSTIILNTDITSSDGTGDASGISLEDVEGVTIDTNGHNINVPVTIKSNNVKLTDSNKTSKGSITDKLTIDSGVSGTSITGTTVNDITNNGEGIKTNKTGEYSYKVEPEDKVNYKVEEKKEGGKTTYTISYRWDNLSSVDITSTKTFDSITNSQTISKTSDITGSLTAKDKDGKTLNENDTLNASDYIDSISEDNKTLSYTSSSIDDLSIDASISITTKIKDSNGNIKSASVYFSEYAKKAFDKIKEEILNDGFKSTYSSEDQTTISNAISTCETAISSAKTQDELDNALNALKNTIGKDKLTPAYVYIDITSALNDDKSEGLFNLSSLNQHKVNVSTDTAKTNTSGTYEGMFATTNGITNWKNTKNSQIEGVNFKFYEDVNGRDTIGLAKTNHTDTANNVEKTIGPNVSLDLKDSDKKNYSYIYLLASSSGDAKEPTKINVKITYSDDSSSSKLLNFYYCDPQQAATIHNSSKVLSGIVGVGLNVIENGVYLLNDTKSITDKKWYFDGASATYYYNSSDNTTSTNCSGNSCKQIAKSGDDRAFYGLEYSIPVDSSKTISNISFEYKEAPSKEGIENHETVIFAITGKVATKDEQENSSIKAYYNGEGYTSLEEAIAAAVADTETTDKKIKLNSNISPIDYSDGTSTSKKDQNINITGPGITIDTNGYSIDTGVNINVKANTTITNSSNDGDGKISGTITVDSGKTLDLTGKVTVEGKITANGNLNLGGDSSVGEVSIGTSGSLTLKDNASYSSVTGGGSNNLNIEGGKFTTKPDLSETFYTITETIDGDKTYYTVTKKTNVTISNAEDLKKALEDSSITDIKLSSDITLTSEISIKDTKTIDLNGHNINTSSSINVGSEANLTVKDESTGNSGSINGTGSESPIKVSYGTLTINSGSVSSTSASAISITSTSGDTYSTVNITGGTISGDKAISTDSNSHINISGGNLKSTNSTSEINVTSGTNSNIHITCGNFNHGFSETGNSSSWLTDGTNSYSAITTTDKNYPYTIASKTDGDAVNNVLTSDNLALLNKDTNNVTSSDLATYKSIVSAYDGLSDAQKNLISEEYKNKITQAKKAVEFVDNYASSSSEDGKSDILNDSLQDTKTDVSNTSEYKTKLDNASNAYTTATSDNDLATKLLSSYKDNLDNKTAAYNYLQNEEYKDVFTSKSTTVTKDDYDKLTKAIDAYSKLKDEVKDLIDSTTITYSKDGSTYTYSGDLVDKKNAAGFLKDLSDKDIDTNTTKITTSSETDYSTISSNLGNALTAYDNLGDAKKYVEGNDTSTTIKDALQAQKDAVDFLKEYASVLTKTTDLTKDDLAKLKEAKTKFNSTGDDKLSDAAKALLDDTVTKLLKDGDSEDDKGSIAKVNAWIASYNTPNTEGESGKDTYTKNILDKTPITDADLETINNALTSYNSLNSYEQSLINTNAGISDVKSKLEEMKKVAEWYKANKTIIEKTTENQLTITGENNDKSLLEKALDYKVTVDEKEETLTKDTITKYVGDKVMEDLTNKKAAVDYKDKYSDNYANSDTAVPFSKEGISKTKEDIQKAIDEYKALSADAKKYTDGASTDDGGNVTGGTYLDTLNTKKSIADILDTYKEVLSKDPSNLDKDDLADLTKASKALSDLSLTEAQKKLIPTTVTTLTDLADAANKFKTDHSDAVNTSSKVTKNNTNVSSALDAYGNLDEGAKKLLSDVKKTLDDKKDVIDWLTGNDKILNDTKVTKDSKSDVDKALSYKIGEGDNEKTLSKDTITKYVEESELTDLNDKKTVSDFLYNNSYKKDDKTGAESGILGKNPITLKDLDSDTKAIEDTKTAYKKLIEDESKGTTYKTLLDVTDTDNYLTELTKQEKTVNFLKKNKDLLSKPINEMSDEDFAKLKGLYAGIDKDTDSGVKDYLEKDTLEKLKDPEATLEAWKLDQAKKKAIQELKDKAKETQSSISSLDNIGDDKDTYTSKLKETIGEQPGDTTDLDKAIQTILSATSQDELVKKKEEANGSIDKVLDEAKEKANGNLTTSQNKAKEEVDKEAEDKKTAIDSLNLTDEEKEAYKTYIEYKKNEAYKAIDSSKTIGDVDSGKDAAKKIVVDTNISTDETNKSKIEAIADLFTTKESKKEIVYNLSGLGDNKSKKTEDIETTITNTIKAIESGNGQNLDKTVEDAKKDMNNKVSNARREDRNSSDASKKSGKVENVTSSEAPNNFSSATIVETNTSDLEEILLSDDEIKGVDNGTNVKVWVKVDEKQKGDSTSSIDEKIESLDKSLSSTQNMELLSYLDITLYKQVGDGATTNPSELNEDITISIKLTSDQINTNSDINRSYKVIRTHEGEEPVVLSASFDGKDTITFKSDKFSTYALIYVDTKIEKKSDTSSNKTAGTCEEVIGKNWTWSTKSKTCVYKVRNTSTN